MHHSNLFALSGWKIILQVMCAAVSARLVPSKVTPVLDVNDSLVLGLPNALGGIILNNSSLNDK